MNNDLEVTVYSLTQNNKAEFFTELEKQLCVKFKCTIDTLPINYGYDKNCGLLHYIDKNDIANYSLLYIDGKFWAGCGGKLRTLNEQLVYQGCWRYFSNTRKVDAGLGSRNFVFKQIADNQLIHAKELGCSFYIISYNLDNYRMYKIHFNNQLPKVYGKNHGFYTLENPVAFNGVDQWLLIKKI